ncbi:MAG: hypothetical protein KKA68_21005 [Gammaproteobacteria bacterium]|nr:hypothetical protein [Gammaproteobacteria bacterium]
MKPIHPIIRTATDNPHRYVVDLGRIGGRRRLYRAGTMAEAEAIAKEQTAIFTRHGSRALDIPTDSIIRMSELLDAIDSRAGRKVTAEAILDYYIKHATGAFCKKKVSVVLTELLAKQGAEQRERSWQTTQSTLRPFVAEFADTPIGDVSRENVSTWLDSRVCPSPSTKARLHRYLHVLFAYAVEKEYIEKNPVDKIKAPKYRLPAKEYMPVESVERVLRAVAEGGEGLAAMAIGFFSGLRTAELGRLTWADVNLDSRQITVGANVSKTYPRNVRMSDNLLAWLSVSGRYDAMVCPRGRRLEAIRADACKRSGVRWPHNAMRVTCATMHYAMHNNAHETAAMLGHAGGTRMFFDHYRALGDGHAATREEAERYWGIAPRRDGNVVAFCA